MTIEHVFAVDDKSQNLEQNINQIDINDSKVTWLIIISTLFFRPQTRLLQFSFKIIFSCIYIQLRVDYFPDIMSIRILSLEHILTYISPQRTDVCPCCPALALTCSMSPSRDVFPCPGVEEMKRRVGSAEGPPGLDWDLRETGPKTPKGGRRGRRAGSQRLRHRRSEWREPRARECPAGGALPRRGRVRALNPRRSFLAGASAPLHSLPSFPRQTVSAVSGAGRLQELASPRWLKTCVHMRSGFEGDIFSSPTPCKS